MYCSKREGWNVNPKRIYRLYKELGLQLRNRTPKRRVRAKLRDDRRPATRTNEIWAMDFVHDQFATGRKLWVQAAGRPVRHRGQAQNWARTNFNLD
ncbi:MAG: transposase [Xanthobacteraceae bacterium]|jgi:putative transposase|nr:transposase [Xanthobacteraceae bacterium]